MARQTLTSKQIEQVAQVEATMAIEGMPLTESCYKNAADVLTGRKTADQVAAEIIRRHTKHGR